MPVHAAGVQRESRAEGKQRCVITVIFGAATHRATESGESWADRLRFCGSGWPPWPISRLPDDLPGGGFSSIEWGRSGAVQCTLLHGTQ